MGAGMSAGAGAGRFRRSSSSLRSAIPLVKFCHSSRSWVIETSAGNSGPSIRESSIDWAPA